MKFRYKHYGTTPRPVIPVIIKNQDKAIGYEVLVDSGADMCLFHAQIGELLGIKIENGKPKEVFGIGGKASIYYIHKITIVVGGWSHEIEAGFMPDVAGRVMPYGVVGQRDFFNLFKKVSFDFNKQEIELVQKTS